MLPTFLVIGAAKCGTTSVCDILREHPDVFMPARKEIGYFIRERSPADRAEYQALFRGAGECTAVGEGSVAYTLPAHVERAAGSIQREIPECRLIYMVRHPVRRLESDWKMRTLEGYEPGPLKQALERYPDLVTIGAYWSHLSTYRRHFSDEQILVVFLEDFAENPGREMIRILRHLGVEPRVPDSVGRRRNSIEARRRAEAVGDIERLIPGVRCLEPYVPGPLRELALRTLASWKRPEPALRWDAQSLGHVADRLREDADQLLRHLGKPTDFWDLDTSVGIER